MDQEGRFIILNMEVYDVRMTLANLYEPNQEDPYFFQHLINEIECIPNDNRIIGGDFNLVLNVEKEKCSRKTGTHKRLKHGWRGQSWLISGGIKTLRGYYSHKEENNRT